MLALPETIGEMIKGWNRIAWFLALLAASFIYLQFLLNPTGDLAQSLRSVNVRTFLGTVGCFLAFSFLTTLLLRRFNPRHPSRPTSTPAALIEISPASSSPSSDPPQTAPSAIPPAELSPTPPSSGTPSSQGGE
jgi:uncharacterized membrane protein YbhN (UPF0104 family)